MIGDKKQILIADDEPNLRRVLGAQLTRDGHEVHLVADGGEALSVLKDNHIDLLICDLRMPVLDGMELLREALVIYPGLPVIMITAHGTVDNAVEALKTGAFDYITKPFDQEELRAIVRKALRTQDLSARDATPANSAANSKYGIIGQSAAISEVYSVIERVADSPTTVLVTGESGTGKELVARALHEQSSRRDRPFIKVNCAAIPRELIESEFFGHERGAFTGAVASKPGRFELASGGTLFLDEIGSIPLETQVKLLRALQEGEFERVGGVRTLKVDVRLVAATNTDLKKQTEEGSFREDLFYRLNVVAVRLPALRERVGDIPLLVDHFVQKYNQRLGKALTGLNAEALNLLSAYHWPGNVRELENVLERAILFADGDRVFAEHLPADIKENRVVAVTPSLQEDVGLKEQVRAAINQLERQLIYRALEQMNGNVTHTARVLKLSRKGLQLKMKELGLRDVSLRPGKDAESKS
jgi:two-component system, NtrC family, response regulator AtoC